MGSRPQDPRRPAALTGTTAMVQQIVARGTSAFGVVAIALIVGAKFALPVLIVRFPFAAGWANFFLDGFDGDLLIPLGLPDSVYQPVDKMTDWMTYVAIVVVAFRNGWPTKWLMLGLFLYRSIGQVTFLATGNELLLARSSRTSWSRSSW